MAMKPRILAVATLAASLVARSAGAFDAVTLADYSGAELFRGARNPRDAGLGT